MDVRVRMERKPGEGLDVDVSLFVLDASGRVRGDRDMVFYNQQTTPDGRITMTAIQQGVRFRIQSMPAGAERLVVAVVADDRLSKARRLDDVGTITIEFGDEATFTMDMAGTGLGAVMLGEVYLRGGATKVKALGQGFDGGLEPLSRHFGVEIETARPAVRTSLVEARMISLEKSDPKLADLARKARVSLAKTNAGATSARVVLVLDVSGSMRTRFRDGTADRLIQRALAYGLNLDDDGRIDVIIFDDEPMYVGMVDADTYRSCAGGIAARKDIWGQTEYASAMAMVRRHCDHGGDGGPVFVMFVTDGGTKDRKAAERQMIEASAEPFFWKFMAIGKRTESSSRKRNVMPRGFDFLAYLDDMPGRVVDNANAFTVESPDEVEDAEFYDLMSDEYASWLRDARGKGIVRS